MKKTTVFTETKMDGKLNVTVTVTRTYGKETKVVNADGDMISIDNFEDTYRISVKLEGEINKEIYSTGYHIASDCKTRVIDCGRIEINGKKRPVVLTLECMDEVVAACHELLTDEISPIDESRISAAKNAIEQGHVLPYAELKAKREEYRDGMLEGGDGYNPYDYYVEAEEIELLKSKYPKMF